MKTNVVCICIVLCSFLYMNSSFAQALLSQPTQIQTAEITLLSSKYSLLDRADTHLARGLFEDLGHIKQASMVGPGVFIAAGIIYASLAASVLIPTIGNLVVLLSNSSPDARMAWGVAGLVGSSLATLAASIIVPLAGLPVLILLLPILAVGACSIILSIINIITALRQKHKMRKPSNLGELSPYTSRTSRIRYLYSDDTLGASTTHLFGKKRSHASTWLPNVAVLPLATISF